MHEAVEHRDVGAGQQLQMHVGAARHVDAPGIGDDELRALAHGLLDVDGADGVRLARVGADDEDRLGVLEVLERVGHGAAAQGLDQAGDRGGVAEPRAVVDVLRAPDGAHELLEDVVVLVGTARRREAGKRVGAVLGLDRAELRGHQVESLVPGGGLELTVAPYQRLPEPLRVSDELEPVAPLDAQIALAGADPDRRSDLDDVPVFDLQIDGAAAAAERAHGAHRLGVPDAALLTAVLVLQRPCGAGAHAVAAHLALGLDHGAAKRGGDQRVEAALGEVEHLAALDLLTDAHAAAAEDALGGVVGDERRVVAGRVLAHRSSVGGGGDVVAVGHLL